MINVLILILTIALVELLKRRRLDFKYSVPIFMALISSYIINKQVESSFFGGIMLIGIGIALYSFCIATDCRKKLVRLIQENAILKYDLEKR